MMKKLVALIFLSMLTAGVTSAQVIDAWTYTGAPDGSALNGPTGCASTGVVGGVKWSAPPAAYSTFVVVSNEMQRFEATGVVDTPGELYFGVATPSDGENTAGTYQFSYDVVSADFSNTAVITNGSANIGYGFKQGGTMSLARIAFLSNDGAPSFLLQVRDDLTAGFSTVTNFPGASISDLTVRQVYDLTNRGKPGSYEVYFTLGGGSEVLVHTGQLQATLTSKMSAFFQAVNGGTQWQAGDVALFDNIVLTQLEDAPPQPPAPEAILIDLWDYAGLADGSAYGTALSTGTEPWAPGGVSFYSQAWVQITNSMARWSYEEGAGGGYYGNGTPSFGAGASNGLFQLSWDFPLADFTQTAAADGTAWAGILVNDQDTATKEAGFRLMYLGTADNDKFQLRYKDSVNTYAFTTLNFEGHVLTNLSVRMELDLDNAGSAGSLKLYYSHDGAPEVAAVTDGTLHAGFKIGQYKHIIQQTGGGGGWQVGDTMYTDNLRFERLGEPENAEELLAMWMFPYNETLGAETNLTDNFDGDLLNNLYEYASGGNPTISDAGYESAYELIEADGANYMQYVYAERNDAEARGLQYVLETRENLMIGSWGTNGYERLGSSTLDAEFNWITNRVSSDALDKQFIRLKIDFVP